MEVIVNVSPAADMPSGKKDDLTDKITKASTEKMTEYHVDTTQFTTCEIEVYQEKRAWAAISDAKGVKFEFDFTFTDDGSIQKMSFDIG